MDLLQLRYFLDSATTENFSKTAEKHLVPPSSVSAATKRLEQELGVSLFDRTSNRITLNQNGRLLAEALHTAFDRVEQAVGQIRDKAHENSNIRLLVRARSKWVTDLVIEYKQTHPGVCFQIAHDFETQDFDVFDVIVDEQSDGYGAKERFLLSVEQICIKAAKSSPLAGKSCTLRQLREQPFVMMSKGNAMRRLLESTGKRLAFTPNVAIECTDRQCLFRFVEQGLGLAVGSRHSLLEEEQKNLVALDVSDFKENQSVYVYHRKAERGDAALRSFTAFLRTKSRM